MAAISLSSCSARADFSPPRKEDSDNECVDDAVDELGHSGEENGIAADEGAAVMGSTRAVEKEPLSRSSQVKHSQPALLVSKKCLP